MDIDTLYQDTNIGLYNCVLQVSKPYNGPEPVSLQEAREWCRIDVTDNDTTLATLIIAARELCEDYLNLALVARTIHATVQTPNGYMRLPYGPVISISNAEDADGIPQEYTLNGLGIKTSSTPSIIVYVGGYGDAGEPLPAKFKIAILNQVLYMYDNRGDLTTLSPAVMQALQPYRLV